jgi:hypothetical protein
MRSEARISGDVARAAKRARHAVCCRTTLGASELQGLTDAAGWREARARLVSCRLLKNVASCARQLGRVALLIRLRKWSSWTSSSGWQWNLQTDCE